MDEFIYQINKLDNNINTDEIISSLEKGQIIYLEDHYPKIKEFDQIFLTQEILARNSKNVSYNFLNNKISGIIKKDKILTKSIQDFMHSYALLAKHLVDTLLPNYSHSLEWGRTSFRPAEIQGRKTSKRKDDTRLHVDAFPSTPVHGKRILRVFSNINPHNQPRVWHVGEPFFNVLQHFKNEIPNYRSFTALLLKLAKITKTKRSKYDHFMLNLHDKMKLNDDYQNNLAKKRIEFPANSTWIVFTDQVSHAALSGKFLLEQTFYLPINCLKNPEISPFELLQDLYTQ